MTKAVVTSHLPSNAIKDYDYVNPNFRDSTCIDWKNFPDFKGERQYLNCQAWGCNDKSWQEFWFSSLPRKNGAVVLQDKSGNKFLFSQNWWYYLLYPDNSIDFVENPPLPTITPTSTPTPPPSCNPSVREYFDKGDANCDRRTDDLDYILWWKAFNINNGGDFEPVGGDGDTDEADYEVWLRNYGSSFVFER